jgi:DNA-binding PadR family transcriptional regulator
VKVTPALAEHWRLSSSIALELAREFPRAEVLSAAELRLEERLADEPVASAEISGGLKKLHRPDLIVRNGGRPIAIEVELSPKGAARLEHIMRAWRRARHVEGVRYYVRDGTTRRAVERAIRRAHAEERVSVHVLGGLK